MASGKRLKSGYELIDRNKTYTVDEAAKIIKEAAKAKFDETIEISVNLGVDPRHADQMVRGSVAMPNGTGKTMRVAVFARDAKAEEAKSAGAEFVGAEDLAGGDWSYSNLYQHRSERCLCPGRSGTATA